jgi:hypothetical protein
LKQKFSKPKIVTGGTKEARKVLRDLQNEDSLSSEKGKQTSDAKLLEIFLEHCEAMGNLRPFTIKTYCYYFRTPEPSAIIRIDLIVEQDLDKFYSFSTKNGYSVASVRKFNTLISTLLQQAIKWNWLTHSVARDVTIPNLRPVELVVPTVDEVKTLQSQLPASLDSFSALIAVTGARLR